jgi:hypothetical protein
MIAATGAQWRGTLPTAGGIVCGGGRGGTSIPSDRPSAGCLKARQRSGASSPEQRPERSGGRARSGEGGRERGFPQRAEGGPTPAAQRGRRLPGSAATGGSEQPADRASSPPTGASCVSLWDWFSPGGVFSRGCFFPTGGTFAVDTTRALGPPRRRVTDDLEEGESDVLQTGGACISAPRDGGSLYHVRPPDTGPCLLRRLWGSTLLQTGARVDVGRKSGDQPCR